jgi:hypothetical protein
MRRFFRFLWHSLESVLAHALGVAVVSLLILAATVGLSSLRSNATFLSILNSPEQLIGPGFTTLLLIVGLVYFPKAWRQHNTLKKFGVRIFSHHFDVETRTKDWKTVSGDISRANTERSPLLILGATGKETFAHSKAPLYDAVRSFSGTISILLLKPNSWGFQQRAKDLAVSQDAYREEILDAIDFCKELSLKEKKMVHVRLYTDPPIWKMIITTRALWVQHYVQHQHVEATPLFGFEFREGGSGLLSGFKTVFERRWALSSTTEIELARWDRKRWAKCIERAPA